MRRTKLPPLKPPPGDLCTQSVRPEAFGKYHAKLFEAFRWGSLGPHIAFQPRMYRLFFPQALFWVEIPSRHEFFMDKTPKMKCANSPNPHPATITVPHPPAPGASPRHQRWMTLRPPTMEFNIFKEQFYTDRGL